MTKQEAIKNHRKMWNWIADQIEERKEMVRKYEYFDYVGTPPEEGPLANCFCCEYAKVRRGSNIWKFVMICEHCPIKWPVEKECKDCYCMKYDNLYGEFHGMQLDHLLFGQPFDYKRAAELARQIANLPEREGI